MNDNLDDWLNSLGSETLSNQPAVQHIEEPSPEPQNLSDQDFDDILGDFGFTRPEDIEAEEVTEENEEDFDVIDPMADDEESDHPNVTVADYEDSVYNENQGEGRDLDAEEDADWQEAIDSGRVVPLDDGLPEQTRQVLQQYEEEEAVHFHMPDGDVVDVPIISENSASEEPLLPLNSPTLLLDEFTTRFSGAEWYHEIQKQSIIIAGMGGIGSNLVYQLARMHPLKIVMYDDDTVEAVNMAGQLYARNDIGKAKVNAMSDMITAYTNMQNVYALQQRFEASTEAGNVMMCGFDNMEARKIFFAAWANRVHSLESDNKKKCLFLDGRLSLETLQVFCITGDDEYNIDRYKNEFLFSDEEAEHTACSMKQTTYLACMIGSIMTNLFTNWAAGLLDPVIPYDLPFFTEYDAQNMIFKTVK